jgi:hypothetical protein
LSAFYDTDPPWDDEEFEHGICWEEVFLSGLCTSRVEAVFLEVA